VSVGARSPVEVDYRSGRVRGAGGIERCGIMMMQAAASVTLRLDIRGFSWAARAISAALPSRSVVRVMLDDDCAFEMPYGDAYWSLLLLRNAEYEDDMHGVMEAIAPVDYVFVDCGANYGYWSVLVTGKRLGGHAAVAIEAAPDTFAWLNRNAAANGGRFAAMNRAIGDRSGLRVPLYGAKHEARSVVGEDGARPIAEVETLALDDLLARPEFAGGRPIVLKLDVEGVEVAALAGAPRMLERDVLIAYEDHGMDRSHAASAHLAGNLGMRLFAFDRTSGREIVALDELTAIKRHRWVGYDFFATRSPLWVAHLEPLCRGAATARIEH
jgi:FkbM family methyltransferase